jgi:hypothetical protein
MPQLRLSIQEVQEAVLKSLRMGAVQLAAVTAASCSYADVRSSRERGR